MKTPRVPLTTIAFIFAVSLLAAAPQEFQKPSPPSADTPRLTALKEEAIAEVDKMATLTQQMVDEVFSFAELGFQEYETSKYLTDVLKKNGFAIQKEIAGIPTAWMATWGSGKPFIALGTDIDCIPQASQKPGVAYHDPIIEGAPGHGEGHNAGQAINITAALAVKKLMQREGLSGTIKLWPGVAEELLGSKAYFVRDGYFKNVDVCLFLHVGDNLSVQFMDTTGTGDYERPPGSPVEKNSTRH
jgi:aminobenzoyl-glutamate utilization protein B